MNHFAGSLPKNIRTCWSPLKKVFLTLLEGTKDPQRFGDAVTDMYEALEAMAKIVTGKPTKDLSALREEFIAKLRLPETHKIMLKQYIDYGCDFRPRPRVCGNSYFGIHV